jgi:hypothetical protein
MLRGAFESAKISDVVKENESLVKRVDEMEI